MGKNKVVLEPTAQEESRMKWTAALRFAMCQWTDSEEPSSFLVGKLRDVTAEGLASRAGVPNALTRNRKGPPFSEGSSLPQLSDIQIHRELQLLDTSHDYHRRNVYLRARHLLRSPHPR
jgi:hypothetical protein